MKFNQKYLFFVVSILLIPFLLSIGARNSIFAAGSKRIPKPTIAVPTPTKAPTPSLVPTRTSTPTPTQPVTPALTSIPTPVMISPTSTVQPSASSLVIFEDGFSNGWTDASYFAVNAQTTTSVDVYSGTRAIVSTLNADGGLDFQSTSGVNTNNYAILHFALKASQSNQHYEVYADSVYGQPFLAPVSLDSYGGQPTASGWKIYDIPLSDLGAVNRTIKDIVIHEAGSSNEPALYVDQVILQSGSVSSPTGVPTPTQTVITPTPNITTPTPAPSQGTYYMALGDSLAFGFHLVQYQQEVMTNSYNPSSFNDGYDAIFFHNLQGINPQIQEINYACPGETSASFINGGCAFHTTASSLHSSYPASQSQLQAALSFIKLYPGSVSTITINIGVNEAINLSTKCEQQSNPQQCYIDGTPAILSSVRQNYENIITSLKQAAPNANIIIVKSPNPVYQDGSDNLVNGLNQIQEDIAVWQGVKLADTYSIFTADTVCSYTNFCSTPSDFHPTALGYSVMAGIVWSASGYAGN